MAIQSINASVNVILDAVYKKTAGPMLSQITALVQNRTSHFQQSLKKLDMEAKRLHGDEKKMNKDNAQLQQTLNDYKDVMKTTATLIQANDNKIQEAGMLLASVAVTAKVFKQLSGRIIAAGGNPVSPQAFKFYKSELAKTTIKWSTTLSLDKVKSFVDSPEWIARMEKWGAGYADLTRDAILKAIDEGSGPIATASKLRQLAENIPVSASENLTRTLQLTSYREASLAMEKVNGGYITGKIRIAELDDVTCLSCIALHGTPLDVGERVDDHYNGRCSEYYQVPGGDEFPSTMQADSKPGERNFVPFQTGTDWFDSLSPERQQQQGSFMQTPAKWEAFKSGIPLETFIGEHEDDVFGNQFIEQSLLQALGEEKAKEFYQ